MSPWADECPFPRDQSESIFFRNDLRALVSLFASIRLSLEAVDGRVGRLGVLTRCISVSRSAMRSYATSRFALCERRSVAVTISPVGRWRKRTPVSTLLRC